MKKSRLTKMPMLAADLIRLLADLTAHGLALLPAAVVFRLLWRTGSAGLEILAFPAAYCGLVVGFWISILLMRLIFLRRISPGTYPLSERGAVRWIIANSLMRLIQRSFLRGYIDDFAPVRYLFYRLLGAKIDRTFFLGWDAKVLDPWGIEVGRNVVIGSYAVISAHSVEGDRVILENVKIHDGATIGFGSPDIAGSRDWRGRDCWGGGART